jgi:hypothetical protein
MSKSPPKRRVRLSVQEIEHGRALLAQERPRVPRRKRTGESHSRSHNGWTTVEGYTPGYRDGNTVWIIRLGPARELPDGRRVRDILLVPLSLESSEKGYTTSRVSMDRTLDFKANADDVNGEIPARGFVHTGGRPRKNGADGTISELSQQGLGARAIATELRNRGIIRVSYRTVARRLNESRV